MSDTRLPRPPADPVEVIIAIEQSLNALEDHPLAGMVLLKPQVVTTADTRIYHGLGQRVKGYIIVRSSSGAVVFDSPTAPEVADPNNYIVLRATSGTPTVTLAVF